MGGEDNVDLMMDNRKLSVGFVCFELRIIDSYPLDFCQINSRKRFNNSIKMSASIEFLIYDR